jgi:hypothetical protein
MSVSVAPAFASSDAMMDLLKVLRDQGTISQDAYEALRLAAMADEEKNVANVQKEVAAKVATAPVATAGAVAVAAGSAAPAAAPASSAPAKAAWTDTIALKGDLRTRYDYTDREGNESRGRGRLRYRLGVIANPIANMEVGAGIASGAGDQRSTNQTFDQVFSGKQLNLDYAYMQYGFGHGVTAVAGKFSNKNYLWTPTDMMWDTDINPEGASVKYTDENAIGNFYAQGGVWVLSESKATSNDAYLVYGQIGQGWKSGDWFGTVAATTYVFSHIKDTNSPFHRGGNTDTHMNSFNLAGEFGTKIGPGTASVIGEFVNNYETSSSQDIAWSVGSKYVWDKLTLKYLYVDLDANAVPDFLPDSDRFEGDTGIHGHEFEIQYEIIKHIALGLDYYHVQQNVTNVDENRVQADINVKF